MTKPKFKFTDEVIVKGNPLPGVVMEQCPTADGGNQYRVRIDMTDKWYPEADVKSVVPKKPVAPPKPPVVKK